ncbi:glycosyltransferase family 4 protein [bacterium]|nr:glycosyltransferase family 4 protein [bacterium]
MIQPLNIAVVAACPFPTSQGSQVLIRESCEALAKRGHNVHVVTYHFGEDLPCPGLTIHRIPKIFKYNKFRSGPALKKPLLDILLAIKLDEVVRKNKIDVIHCHNYEAPVAAFPVKLLRNVPVVYHSHNTMSDEFYTYFRLKIPQTIARFAARLMDRYIPRMADYSIAINRKVAEFLFKSGISPSTIKFIPPGIDYGDPVEVPDRDLLNKYQLQSQKLLIYAGNLDGYQRIDLILDALPDIIGEHPDSRLLFLTGSNSESLMAEIIERDLAENISIINDLSFDEIKHILAVGCLAVNPRIAWSGFPIKLLNYFAAGLPVVAFEDAAPCVDHCHNGLLAKAGDYKEFAKCVNYLLSNPEKARQIGRNARSTVEELYSWDRIAAEIEMIYAELLSLERETSGFIKQPEENVLTA